MREMYEQWPFFREMIDLIAMTLSKTDREISLNYETQLVGDAAGDPAAQPLVAVGAAMRGRLEQTRDAVLAVTGCADLYSGFELLKRSMKVRNPYVDPLNVLQAEIMKRLRADAAGGAAPAVLPAEDKATLEDSFIVSVNGIAQGMKNSG